MDAYNETNGQAYEGHPTERMFPRTLSEAFPDDKADYACPLERPQPQPPMPWGLIAFVCAVWVLCWIVVGYAQAPQ